MKLSLDSSLTAEIVKAIAEFNLIDACDKIAVGVSGGKDSSFLLYCLKILQLHFKIDFSLKAVYVDPGFGDSQAEDNLSTLTKELGVDFKVIRTKIKDYIQKDSNPCSKCAHFRKGAIIEYLNKINYNKLAFGHHLDDAVETFLLSIFYSGQLQALKANRYLSENKINIIRPLIYLRETQIENEIEKKNFKIAKSSCPYDDASARSKVRQDFKGFFEDEQLFANLISAMRKKDNFELWPQKMDYNILKKKMKNYWK
ncbi:tRNA lysidine(34) synthetase [Halanaerobium hydrogeniformans]|uniref:PP-loop domain protein n=1 Tax=Halanaerobium hydrogeniformans TaxID=656519 RepID=E4RLS2_HALHG|nr:tRNA 2-thiocytidine biosynthesis TtcA family protein [Halanaerobium hydrogeniformans]ADQ14986.1 PP-loop domain protein [Halanaerobium hydrogeniformans]